MTTDDHHDPHAEETPVDAPRKHLLSRREAILMLSGAGLGSAAVVYATRGGTPAFADHLCLPPGSTTTTQVAQPPTTAPPTPTLPSPVGTWSERYGSDEGDVVLDTPVLLDIDASVQSLTMTATGRLVFDPEKSLTLTSRGNVTAEGEIVMRPNSPATIHRIHFEGVDESAYQGGGMAPLASDVGLWIVNQGMLSANGHPRTSWTRATGDLTKGATTIAVADAAGWQVGDRIAITPTGAPSPDSDGFHQDSDCAQTYDDRTITAISGNTVTVDSGLDHDHPQMTFTQWDGASRSLGAEVLNLTRNVIVSGTAEGRAHVIFVHCHHAQNVSDVHFHHLGPRHDVDGRNGKTRTEGVAGRYPFHMHHCGDGSRGSVIKNCLVTASGNRAFVPHESHGVTLDGCVAHDVHGTAFWWDQPGRHNPTGEDPKTHDSLWTHCVASKVYAPSDSENGYRMAGFNLSAGNPGSNALVHSVAVGVYEDRVTNNSGTNAGFHWTEHGHGIWKFEHCLAHNIGGAGILSWQNDEEIHPLTDFVAYHCAGYGIEHGAYSNFYNYERLTLVGNRLAGIGQHAVTRRTNSVRRRWTDQGKQAPTIEFRDVRIDGRGVTTDGVRGLSHKFAASVPDGPTVYENVTIENVRRAGFYEDKGKNAQYYLLRNCTIDGVEAVMFGNGAPSATRVDVENLNGDAKAYTIAN